MITLFKIEDAVLGWVTCLRMPGTTLPVRLKHLVWSLEFPDIHLVSVKNLLGPSNIVQYHDSWHDSVFFTKLLRSIMPFQNWKDFGSTVRQNISENGSAASAWFSWKLIMPSSVCFIPYIGLHLCRPSQELGLADNLKSLHTTGLVWGIVFVSIITTAYKLET